MSFSIDIKIIAVMSLFRVNRKHIISDQLSPGMIYKCGFEFHPAPFVKGLIIIGKEYPLSQMDLPIETHLDFVQQFIRLRSDQHGMLINLGERSDEFIYHEVNSLYDWDGTGLPPAKHFFKFNK